MTNTEKELEAKVSKQRANELYHLWRTETEDQDTQDWREELTADEKALVDIWDNNYNNGIREILKAMLKAEAKRK